MTHSCDETAPRVLRSGSVGISRTASGLHVFFVDVALLAIPGSLVIVGCCHQGTPSIGNHSRL